MRHLRNNQWDLVTVMVLFVFVVTGIFHSESVAFVAAAITFVVFRPRRRRLIRPSRIAQRVMTRKVPPAKMPTFRPRMSR